LKHLARIIARIRQCWPGVRILVRGDSGFCRDHLVAWCEAHGVDYLFGLAKNTRLLRALAPGLAQAEPQYRQARPAARMVTVLSVDAGTYGKLRRSGRQARLVGKVAPLVRGLHPRFVVTNREAEAIAAEALYEHEYCARGDMENRIKEQQLALFANRVSCATM